MICYTLWLNMDHVCDQTGEKIEKDPLFLQLGYASFKEANEAKKKLEDVYGKDKVFVSADGPRINLFE
jgi:hypothetical protein